MNEEHARRVAEILTMTSDYFSAAPIRVGPALMTSIVRAALIDNLTRARVYVAQNNPFSKSGDLNATPQEEDVWQRVSVNIRILHLREYFNLR
jgi:hypothetical protein